MQQLLPVLLSQPHRPQHGLILVCKPQLGKEIGKDEQEAG